MAVDEKDETVNSETETETKDETLESGDVVTSPTVETLPNDEKYVQLEQRITSLEQRFNGQEQQQQSQDNNSSNQQSDNDNDNDSDDSDDSDNMESSDEIKKILGL